MGGTGTGTADEEQRLFGAESPLELFDTLNTQIWKEANHPEVVEMIETSREKVKTEPDLVKKYGIVMEYMDMARHHALGRTDIYSEEIQKIADEYEENMVKIIAYAEERGGGE